MEEKGAEKAIPKDNPQKDGDAQIEEKETEDLSTLEKSGWRWRKTDDEKLLRCVRRIPPGHPKRWERIAAAMNAPPSPRADPTTGENKEVVELDQPHFSKEDLLQRLSIMFNEQAQIHVQEEELEALMNPLSTLFQDHPFEVMQELSQNERRNNNFKDEQLVYAETDLKAFLKIMLLLRKLFGHLAENGGKFWDIGCGGGKLLFAAALVHSFDMCFGFEILDSLYNESRLLHRKYEREIKPTLREAKQRVHFEIQKRDALVVEGGWDEATFIIIHVCWRDLKTLTNLQEKLERMPTGSICISIAKPFVSDNWERLAVSRVQTSWGKATVYIWEKL